MAAAVLGLAGVAEWTLGLPAWSQLGGLTPMMPNTALGLLLIGTAGALLGRQPVARAPRLIAWVLAVVVLGLGLITLVEYASGGDYGVDLILVPPTRDFVPGRPSPLTALALVMLGAALLLCDLRPRALLRPAEWLAILAALIALTGLFALALRAGGQVPLGEDVIKIALPTGIGLVLAAVGMLLARPQVGLMGIMISPTSGGLMMRRMTIGVLSVPPLLAFATLRLFAGLGVEDPALLLATQITGLAGLALLFTTITSAAVDRAYRALAESERQTQDLLEQAPDGIFIADHNGRYIGVNSAGSRMLGYEPHELVGMYIEDLLPPDDLPRFAASKERLLSGSSDVGEWRLRRRDGSLLPVEVSATILDDGRWQGFARDITERKRSEELLRQAMERYELALRGAELAAWDWNVTTGEIVFNRRWSEMRGYAPEEIAPHVDAWVAGIHPDDWPQVQRLLREHFEGRLPEYDAEHRVRTKSGRWTWVLDRGRVFARDAQGKPTRMVGTALDITERKQAEIQQRLLAEAGTVFSASLDYEETLTNIAKLLVRELADFCIVDVIGEKGGVRRLQITSRDPAKDGIARRLANIRLDWEGPHLVSRTLKERQPMLVEHLSKETLVSLSQSPEHWHLLQALNPQSLIVVPLLAHDQLLGDIALISNTPFQYGTQDVMLATSLAERAALSIENARLYRAAREAIQARDEVLGVVAHDLRNPLNVIAMQAELLRAPPSMPERRSRRPGEVIARAASRMSHIIGDLLDISQLEAGRLHLDRRPLFARRLVDEAAEAHRAMAASASLELWTDSERDLPDVWADRNRILQVFDNLIGNAIKFTGRGGRVIVGATPGDGHVVFWVADTGPGIPADGLPNVFDRFWQARRSDRRGAGLGLPIVRGIVEAHGGRVWVESEPQVGTTFFFTLPTRPRSTEQPSEEQPMMEARPG